MAKVEKIEQFFGVYLLHCENPKYFGRTYIGFTVNPNRRILQHNKGKKFGGAYKTSQKGPWKMVLIIHGFPNDVSALRFEWAWQHPQISRRLRHVSRKKSNEKQFDFHLRLLTEMLQTGPWNRLPLTIRWLDDSFVRDFSAGKTPPIHMPICYGQVVVKKSKDQNTENEKRNNSGNKCTLCNELIPYGKELKCLSLNCNLISHVICLSKFYLTGGEYVPVEGTCPVCEQNFLWGEIIRKYKGCYNNNECYNSSDSDDD